MGTFGRLGGIAAIALLAASGVVAFATIAPSSEYRIEPPKRPIIEALPIRPDAAPAPKSYFREELYQRGDTLPVFLDRLGIEAQQATRLAKLRVLQSLKPGTHVSAEVSAEGEPVVLSFLSGRDTLVKIAAEANGHLRVTDDKAQLYTRVAMKAGVVQSSLFAAAACSPPSSPTTARRSARCISAIATTRPRARTCARPSCARRWNSRA